jgi:predicted GNAT family acetyltransferase
MKIVHDKEQNIFFAIIDGKESYLRYIIPNKETINIILTYVPHEQRQQRHQGIAGKIVKAALDYAKENNLKVIPTCSYVDYFIDVNKEYEELLL